MRARLYAQVAVAILLAAATARAPETLPEACERLEDRYVECAWSVPPRTDEFLADAPAANRSLVFLFLTFDAGPYSYVWSLCEKLKAPASCVGSTGRFGLRSAEGFEARMTSVDFPADQPLEFSLRSTGNVRGTPPVSTGTIHVRLAIEALPAHEAAPLQASAESPHLVDERGEPSAPPALDIVSAWFNDPLLDDGFVNATLQLADLGAAEDAAHARRYELDWTLRSDRFRVRWTVTNETTATLWRETGGRQKPLIELPVETDRANGTLTSSIPLRLIGQPRAGDVFTDLRANASRHVAAFGLAPSDYQQADGLGDPGVVDEAAQTVRPFRLRGGSDLEEAPRDEPLVFEPSPPAEALDATGVASASAAVPWYQAPFAADNLPNTLQVAGAMAAVLTFLAGLLLLARRRSLVQKLVDAVEAARRENEGDAEKLAAAVRAVEARAHDLAARGRLDAREFALVTRRIDQALRRS